MSEIEIFDKLPPVAKSFFTFCKKCDANRYHTVLAHKTETSAKVKCESCGAQSTYSLPKAKPAKSTKAGTGAKITRVTRATSHKDEYQLLLSQVEANQSQAYSMKAKFALNTKLNHPKFGIGIVKNVYSDKIDVVFSDEVKTLMHNRV